MTEVIVRSAERAEAVASEIRAGGRKAIAIQADVSVEAEVQAMFARVDAELGPVGALVNNAAITRVHGPWTQIDEDGWDQVMASNVKSCFLCCRAVHPHMVAAGWGRIIWLGTIGGLRPAARMPHYYASKSALMNVCLSLAKELTDTGITVNLVSPGIISTEEIKTMMRKRAKKEGWGDDWSVIQRKALEGTFENPTGRFAEPNEVADLVTFLASNRAAYINASNLRIDGGATDCAI